MNAAVRARTALPIWLTDRWGMMGVIAGAYVAAYTLWTFFDRSPAETRSLVSNVAFLPMSLFAAVAAGRVALDRRLKPLLRRAWLFLSLCAGAYFAGDLVFLYLENISRLPSVGDSVNLSDLFYLLFYPLALIGLLSLPRAPVTEGEWVKFGLDLATVMITAWMGVWYFVISPAAQGAAALGASADWLDELVSAAYPVGDLVVMAGLVYILLRRPDAATRSALILLLAGLVCFVASDLLYAYFRLADAYDTGTWIDLGWIIAYWCFALAALRQPYLERGSRIERVSARVLDRLSIILPFVAIGLGYAMVMFISITRLLSDTRLLGLFSSMALLTVCVVGRQAAALVENRRLTVQLRAFSTHLEQRVVERTQQLQAAQEELLSSQKLAIVGTLAAELVHEVSNPLNTIINAGEVMEQQLEGDGQVDPATLKEFLPIISRAAWHATRILQSLRSFSRGGTAEMVPQTLADVASDALMLVQPRLAGWQDIRLETSLPSNLPPVVCDRNQIAQVLINLINNARDAMPNGGTISLSLRSAAPNVILEVQDEGVGIAPEALDNIFTPFYTTKPIGKGSGLGLSIVERIVRAHGGAISASSPGVGQGATFTVTLPAAPES